MNARWTLLLTLLAAPAPQAGIYKWTDAEGTVHFSQTPPRAVPAEPVEVSPPPPDSGLGDPALPEAQKRFDQWYTERKKREAEAAREAEEAKRRRQRCEKARANLAAVTSRGRVRVIRGDEAVALTEEERQALIRKLEEQIREFCQ
jgi:hypothetical protein